MILLPSMPCDSTAAAMALLRSGASQTAWAWGWLMAARAGWWRMSVVAPHGTTPSDSLGSRSGDGEGVGAAGGDADGDEAVDAQVVGDGQRFVDPVTDGTSGLRSRQAIAGTVDADDPQARVQRRRRDIGRFEPATGTTVAPEHGRVLRAAEVGEPDRPP